MLELEGVNTYYGDNHILFDVDIQVDEGEVVTLVGRNGVGKTTTLRSIMGMAEVREGSITYEGENVTNRPPNEIAGLGIGYIPEEREVFGGLSVRENLRIAGTDVADRESRIDDALDLFPKLESLLDKPGRTLSGGEQQMLAIARALVGENDLLLIDEPTEGLAPLIAEDVQEAITELQGELTIVLVEQTTSIIFDISDRLYGMVDGEVVFEATPEEAKGEGLVEDVLTVS
jgi:branched-chain amino acid transport system ATP-binding protein